MRTISKLEAAFTQFVNHAASGNLRAIAELLRWYLRQELAENQVPRALVHECDQAVMNSIVKRIREASDSDSVTHVEATPTARGE